MSGRAWGLVSLVALAGVAAFGAGPVRSWWGGGEGEPLPTLVAGHSDLVESTVALGTLRAEVGAEVEVGSRLSGVVERLLVGVGDRVEKGELLAALQDGDLRARVAVARAELAAAEAEAVYAAQELERTERQSELVPALQIDVLRKNVAVRRAAVERARASLAEAELQLSWTEIRAPVGGTVAAVSTSVGETVAASFAAPTFVTLVDLDRLEVQAWVDETDIGRVEIGQEVTVRIDAFPGRTLPGSVRAIYPKAELQNNVVVYVVLVDLDAAARRAPDAPLLRPEMTVHVDFLLERRAGVVTVPRAALLQDGGRTLVVVSENGRYVERPVELGLQTPQRVEIVSGLAPGETIVADKQAWRERKELDR